MASRKKLPANLCPRCGARVLRLPAAGKLLLSPRESILELDAAPAVTGWAADGEWLGRVLRPEDVVDQRIVRVHLVHICAGGDAALSARHDRAVKAAGD